MENDSPTARQTAANFENVKPYKKPRGESVQLKCQACGKDYSTKKFHENRSRYCSMDCRRAAPTIEKGKKMAALVEKERLTPAQSAAIRAEVANYIGEQIKDAHQVVMGFKNWNPTQARVFGMLLNKVVPDLNASFVQHEHTTKQLTDLTREELEAIAQGISTIDVQAEVIDDDSN